MMERAEDPYDQHQQDVEKLMLELKKAYEFVRGVPSNSISAKQWDILIREDGDLVGAFFTKWREKTQLSSFYINEFKAIVSDAFDEIICLEARKKSPSECN
jgi:hypothetical protein